MFTKGIAILFCCIYRLGCWVYYIRGDSYFAGVCYPLVSLSSGGCINDNSEGASEKIHYLVGKEVFRFL